LWYVDLDKKTPVKVDTDLYDSPGYDFRPRWSPDSKWISYARQLHNHLHAVFVYSIERAKTTQLTDGMSDAYAADWDKSGKYLYFLASTNVALSGGWIDMTSIGHPVTSAVYVAVLRKDLNSPLAPQSDDENSEAADKKDEGKKDAAKSSGDKSKETSKDAKEDKKDKTPPEVRIDMDNIGQRILAVPIPEKNFYAVVPGKEGEIYVEELPIVELHEGPPQIIVSKYSFKNRKLDMIVGGVTVFNLSANGEKMLYRTGEQWFINGADAAPKPGEGLLKTTDMEVHVDPRAEWKQMYNETWRIERDFLYDPHFHGLDLKAAAAFYRPWVDELSCRSDLTYLFEEMLGNINVGHMFVGGGYTPDVPKIKVGLLGADYKIENGRYRFARVFNGEN
jgi:tricorn protease